MRMLESVNLAVLNGIFVFFSEMNSVFLVRTFGPLLATLLDQSRPASKQLQMLSFSGVKVF